MAITITSSPQTFTPAFNQVNFELDSTNKNKPGFRYVIDVYRSEDIVNRLHEGRAVPRPGDGFGEVKLREKVARELSYNTDPEVTDEQATRSFVNYTVKFGEEYQAIFTLTNVADNAGNAQYTTSGVHTFEVGDEITLDDVSNDFTGLFTITAITTTTFTINYPYTVGTFPDDTPTGTVVYADQRKIVDRGLVTFEGAAFNGALRNEVFREYDQDLYRMESPSVSRKFLSNIPYPFRVTPEQSIWLNFANMAQENRYLHIYNDSGDHFRKLTAATGDNMVTRVGVGLQNLGTLEVLEGTLPLVKDGTKFVEFYLADEFGADYSTLYHFDIDRRCRIEDVEVMFVDRLGSTPSFAFQARVIPNETITRDTFLKSLGYFSDGEWTYKNHESGATQFSIDVEEVFELNSYYMTDAMSVYFSELVSTPYATMKMGGIWYAVEILDTQHKPERIKNRKLIKKKLTVRLANANNVNV